MMCLLDYCIKNENKSLLFLPNVFFIPLVRVRLLTSDTALKSQVSSKESSIFLAKRGE